MSAPVIAGFENRRLFEHNRRMIERVSFFQKRRDFAVFGRYASLARNIGNIVFKFKNLSADKIERRIFFKRV